jgi:hypothetical protein
MQKMLDKIAEWLDELFPHQEPELRPIPVRADRPRRRR